MNKGKLNAMIQKVSQNTGIVYNSVLAYYFMEDVLLKISKSEYRDNFIFKGGFLLSNIVGISSRATMDMDFLLKNKELSEEAIEQIFDEILKIESTPITYGIDSIKPIREQDFYGGFRVMLLARFENLRQYIPLDIATGDIVTPCPIDYDYISIFDQERISVKAYPIETMVAEKMETIFSRGFLNSRSKDYFDLYLICKLQEDKIDVKLLSNAIKNTFSYRNTKFDLVILNDLIHQLRNNHIFIERWKTYRKKNSFVGDLEFGEVLDTISELLLLLESLGTVQIKNAAEHLNDEDVQ